ncbi:MAG: diaminopimelate epimerase [Bacteroidia bacterium]|nr:diaminopimelate epimerase [Bacteroidia bacterium]
MNIILHKYHGAGNDFLLIDNRESKVHLSTAQIAHLCHRNFGIGADGLMLLENDTHHDFKMVYFNSDGNQSTMCGNGGRCIVLFAHHLGVIKNSTTFTAIDGEHQASINADDTVSLHMIDVHTILLDKTYYEINTGSPHYVKFTNDVEGINVTIDGANIRNQAKYMPNGINVNFVQIISENTLKIRTYERGVENETLACGTGVTAAAIAYYIKAQITSSTLTVAVQARGGNLSVALHFNGNNSFDNIVLTGPAQRVFAVEYSL